MDLLSYHLENVNWLAVVVAVLPSFAIGSVWYMPKVFGNYWIKASGLKATDLQKGSFAKSLAQAALGNLIAVAALSVLMSALDFNSVWQGATLGFLISLAFGATSRLVHTSFEYRPLALVLVNSAHDAVFMTVAGAILGAF